MFIILNIQLSWFYTIKESGIFFIACDGKRNLLTRILKSEIILNQPYLFIFIILMDHVISRL